jgi:chemotaxis protein methyltransferase CheR
MQTRLFEAFQRLAYQQAGIALRDNKGALVAARVAKRVRDLGLSDAGEYLNYLEADRAGTEMVHFLDAITTNFTSFFRENDHFEFLKQEAAGWAASGLREVRVWCAAAATGEEPYTLAMVLSEALRNTGVEFRILATDISVGALTFAAAGRYPRSRLEQIPSALRVRYFEADTTTKGAELALKVVPDLRRRIVFKRLNLATPPFPLRGDLDAVFCRNVMIYFDTRVRQRLVQDIERLLRPGAALVVAHSETLGGVHSQLESVRSSVYRKRVDQ